MALAPSQASGQADRGLRGCTGDQGLAGTAEHPTLGVSVAEVVVDKERGHEHAPQKEELVSLVRVEHRVGGDVAEVCVGRGVLSAMGPRVAEGDCVRWPGPFGLGRDGAGERLGGDHHVRRHRVEAEVPAPGRYVGVGRFDHRPESHSREPPPWGLGGEEAPVAEHVADDCVGHVVGGQREPLDSQPDLARAQRSVLARNDACAAKVADGQPRSPYPDPPSHSFPFWVLHGPRPQVLDRPSAAPLLVEG